jgi:pimeloyl-ACP methyl ester carboxylesterase
MNPLLAFAKRFTNFQNVMLAESLLQVPTGAGTVHPTIERARSAFSMPGKASILLRLSPSIVVPALLLSLVTSAAAETTPPTPTAEVGEFAGRVDIGDGRKLYLECHGSGAPTVILESGYHDSSDPWGFADRWLPPVVSGVAAFARVCAYDRPGTLRYTDPPGITERSTPVPMPRTAADVAHDLHSLLAAAKMEGPYIFVAHSLGGLFVRLYAQITPGDVRAIVLVDAFPKELPALFGSAWPAYRHVLDTPLPQFANDPRFERIDIEASIAEIDRAPPLPRVPLIVITKGEPFARPPGTPATGFAFEDLEHLWPIGAEALVRLEPETPHFIATGSDHYVQVHAPDLVIAAIRLVIQRSDQRK